MSLIFKSLKKLKTRPPESEKIKKPDAGNVYTFRKLIFSPQAAILLFILILTAGFVASEGYRFFLNRLAVEETPSVDPGVKTGDNSNTPENRATTDNTEQYKTSETKK